MQTWLEFTAHIVIFHEMVFARSNISDSCNLFDPYHLKTVINSHVGRAAENSITYTLVFHHSLLFCCFAENNTDFYQFQRLLIRNMYWRGQRPDQVSIHHMPYQQHSLMLQYVPAFLCVSQKTVYFVQIVISLDTIGLWSAGRISTSSPAPATFECISHNSRADSWLGHCRTDF